MDYCLYLIKKVWGRIYPSDDTLEILQLQDIIVKIGRGKWGSIVGFIKSFNEKGIILHVFNQDILGLDGFVFIRKKDCTSLKYSLTEVDDQFFRTCIRVRDQSLEIPSIPSDNIISILNHIKKDHDGICIIYTEEVDNEVETFGILGEIGKDFLKIKTIDRRFNKWSENNTLISIDEITKITWNGEYHKTLKNMMKFLEQEDQSQNPIEEVRESQNPIEEVLEEIIIANPIYIN